MSLPSTVRRSVFRTPPDPAAVRALVDFCHCIALAYIRREARSTRYSLVSHFGLCIEDLALDCIADLFERDRDGHFVQIMEYLEARKWSTLAPPDLESALRRLVFSKVNDGFFRRHREADPNLSRIIRNLKLAAQDHSDLRLQRHQGEQWLLRPADEASMENPLAPPALLKGYLVARLDGTSNIPNTLTALDRFTRDHTYYVPGYPLTQFAQLVRAAFRHLHPAISEQVPARHDEALDREDRLGVIQYVVKAVREDMHSSYVGRGKVSAQTFDAYLEGIRNVLVSHFVDPHQAEDSFFDALQDPLPNLEPDVYRNEHRHRFEYLMKKARPQFVNEMRRAYAVGESS